MLNLALNTTDAEFSRSGVNPPCIYAWPEYCSSCGEMLGIWQATLEILAHKKKVPLVDVAYEHFPRFCCRRFIIAPIQQNFHNMDLNVFNMNVAIPTCSSIRIYCDDASSAVDFPVIYTAASAQIEGFMSTFFDGVEINNVKAEENTLPDLPKPVQVHIDPTEEIVQETKPIRVVKRKTFARS